MVISILKKFVPIPKIQKFNNFLFVGPHPDDIEIACGGTVKSLTEKGKKVTFVVATDGSVGGIDDSLTGEQLAKIRKDEATTSANILGVSDVRFLDFADGGDYDLKQLTTEIAKVISELQPDVVFCPDHKALCECHPDHLNVGLATTNAYYICQYARLCQRYGVEKTAKPQAIAYFFTDRANSFVKVTKTLKSKFLAIREHKSQFLAEDFKNLELYNMLSTLRHGFWRGKGRAEGFCVLANVHQHCFPEVMKY